jgi:hypothetical protein
MLNEILKKIQTMLRLRVLVLDESLQNVVSLLLVSFVM